MVLKLNPSCAKTLPAKTPCDSAAPNAENAAAACVALGGVLGVVNIPAAMASAVERSAAVYSMATVGDHGWARYCTRGTCVRKE